MRTHYNFDPAKAKALLGRGGLSGRLRSNTRCPEFFACLQYRTVYPVNHGARRHQGEVRARPNRRQLLTKYRARQHQMLLVYWGPDYMDPHTNADSFARNPDNSDEAKSKPLAWRNSWDIPEITR